MPCCLGENLGGCNKTCVQTTGLKNLADFTEEERKVLLWRGGKKVCVTDAYKLYICYHHLSKLEGYLKRGSQGSHAAICSKLTSKMLKEAIRFHYSWQPNFLTTDMIVSLVGNYVGHAMILHKKLRRMLAMKCRNLSMNHRKLISWILRQPIIQLAILIQMKQENNQEKIEQRSSVYWRYTHQNTQHAKALQSVLCKRINETL